MCPLSYGAACTICIIFSAGRYFVTSGTRDLYIRSVKADDNLKKFACQTTNKISRERKVSEPVHLSVKGKLLFFRCCCWCGCHFSVLLSQFDFFFHCIFRLVFLSRCNIFEYLFLNALMKHVIFRD